MHISKKNVQNAFKFFNLKNGYSLIKMYVFQLFSTFFICLAAGFVFFIGLQIPKIVFENFFSY